jgi:hypothetical protein
MQHWHRIAIYLGTALWCACTLLPWWSRNGRHISGFGGPALGNPGWWVLGIGGVLLGGYLLGGRYGHLLMRLSAWAGVLFSWAHVWRGYRLEAIGIGLPLLAVISLLNLSVVLFFHRNLAR